MTESQALDRIALGALRSRIIDIIPEQIRACVAVLDEEQLWWRPNETCNSVGNLVLHLSGSVRHYLARGVGGFAYERDRPAEFAERGPLPKEELLAVFNETIELSARALDGFDTARFVEPTDESSYNPTFFHLLLNVAVHMATHAGQIVYVTKMLRAGALDELWTSVHKTYGRSSR